VIRSSQHVWLLLIMAAFAAYYAWSGLL